MSKNPAFYSGQRLTAALMLQTVPDVVIKQNNQDRTNTTTYADDSELLGIPLTVGTWEIVMGIYMVGGAAGIAVKTQWSYTGVWNNPLRQCTGPAAGNTAAPSAIASMKVTALASNADSVYGLCTTATSAAYTLVREEARLVNVTGAGNLALSWAPNVSSATSGGVRQGSWVSARQIG